MMTLPNGYRWANEYETETQWHYDEMLLVHDTEYPEHADVALPVSVPVVTDTYLDGRRPLTCMSEFGDHEEHATCWDTILGMTDGYSDPYDDHTDHEYQNYMYGSGRY